MPNIFCSINFKDFILYEASTLNQIDLPNEMIRKIHTKEEHYSDKYPQMGHTYRSGVAIPMPYQYYIPSENIQVPEPIKLRGRKSSRSPYQNKEIGGEYTDFAWYLQSIPFGEIRVFVVNKETNFFMFLYHKRPSNGAAGEQYAVMGWEPNITTYEVSKSGMDLGLISEKFSVPLDSILKNNPEIKRMAEAWVEKMNDTEKEDTTNDTKKEDTTIDEFKLNQGERVTLPPRPIDYGYSELTTSGVDRGQLRDVHNKKGGNTNGKIQEFVRAMTRKEEKKYAPSLEKPLYIYDLDVRPATEPRTTKEARAAVKGETLSIDFLRVFASRFAKIIARAKPETKEKLINEIDNNSAGRGAQVSPEFSAVARELGSDPGGTQALMLTKFMDFRKELFDEGRGGTQGAPSSYSKTAGFELEQENDQLRRLGVYNTYRVSKKIFSPDEEGVDPETGFRNAQKEMYKRSLPTAGDYASIPSIISQHTLDGAIDKFTAYLVTGKIKLPNVSIAGLLGISTDDTEDQFKKSSVGKGKPSSGSWLF